MQIQKWKILFGPGLIRPLSCSLVMFIYSWQESVTLLVGLDTLFMPLQRKGRRMWALDITVYTLNTHFYLFEIPHFSLT